MENRIRAELEHIRDATAACSVAIAAGDAGQVLEILRERQAHMTCIDMIQAEKARLLAANPSLQGENIPQESDNRRLLQDIADLDRSVRHQADEWNESCRADLRELRTRRYLHAYEKDVEPSSLFLDIKG